jgi:O-antigen/teichoic acid export membrane protein
MISFVALSIVGRFDILALKRYASNSEVGVYGAAIQLATVLPILIGSITSVLLPKASRIESYAHLMSFAKKSLLSSTVVFLLILPIFLFSGPLIRLVFGPEYIPSIPIFRILFWGFMISLFTNPLSVIVFRINKPNYASYGNIAQFAVGLTLYLTLVPRFGVSGAAWANFFVSVTGFTVIFIFMSSIFNKKNAAKVEGYLATSQP